MPPPRFRSVWRWSLPLTALLLAVILCLPGGLSASAESTDAQTPFYLDDFPLVYITDTGLCYHNIPDCISMDSAYLVTLAEAVRLGYRACSKCHPPDESFAGDPQPFPEGATVVSFSLGSKVYHRSASCGNPDNPVALTLEEALYLGKRPCQNCKPPTE